MFGYETFCVTLSSLPAQPKYRLNVALCLTIRYIFHFKNQHRHSGANEDDFMEIKQDISSLR